MHAKRKSLALLTAAVATLLLELFVFPVVRPAHAIIGRPLTPMSYAGVARRTTRRTVAVGMAAGAATAPIYW
jgi:hypothetical protein